MGLPSMPASRPGAWDPPRGSMEKVRLIRSIVLLPVALAVAPCYVLESIKGLLVYAMRPIGFQSWR